MQRQFCALPRNGELPVEQPRRVRQLKLSTRQALVVTSIPAVREGSLGLLGLLAYASPRVTDSAPARSDAPHRSE